LDPLRREMWQDVEAKLGTLEGVLVEKAKTLNSKRDEWLAHRHFAEHSATPESVRRYLNDVVWPLYYYEHEASVGL
jgi:hypothetical protein